MNGRNRGLARRCGERNPLAVAALLPRRDEPRLLVSGSAGVAVVAPDEADAKELRLRTVDRCWSHPPKAKAMTTHATLTGTTLLQPPFVSSKLWGENEFLWNCRKDGSES